MHAGLCKDDLVVAEIAQARRGFDDAGDDAALQAMMESSALNINNPTSLSAALAGDSSLLHESDDRAIQAVLSTRGFLSPDTALPEADDRVMASILDGTGPLPDALEHPLLSTAALDDAAMDAVLSGKALSADFLSDFIQRGDSVPSFSACPVSAHLAGSVHLRKPAHVEDPVLLALTPDSRRRSRGAPSRGHHVPVHNVSGRSSNWATPLPVAQTPYQHHYEVWRSLELVRASVICGGAGRGVDLTRLWRPLGLAVDGAQQLFIVDNGNQRVLRWSPGARQGQLVRAWSRDICSEETPFDVAVASDGSCVVSVNQGVELRAPDTHAWGLIDFDIRAAGIAISPVVGIFWVDRIGHCVRHWDGDGPSALVAGSGQRGSSLNRFNCPCGIAVAADGSFFIADSGNHRVVRWTPGANKGEVVAGGQGKGSRLDQLCHPRYVAVDDCSGDVYVADTFNHRVIRWSPGASKGVVVAGGRGAGSRVDQLNEPVGIVLVYPQNELLIADSRNHRVVRWLLAPYTSLT